MADPTPEVAALDPEIAAYSDPAHSLGYLLRLAFRAFARALEEQTAPYGVSSGQWRFLRQLWIDDGLTQRELSRRVGMREPTTVVAVNSLIKAGFVYRIPSQLDRRKVHIHLTPKARALQATLLPLVAEVNAVATAGIDAKAVAELRVVLAQINANLVARVGVPIQNEEESSL